MALTVRSADLITTMGCSTWIWISQREPLVAKSIYMKLQSFDVETNVEVVAISDCAIKVGFWRWCETERRAACLTGRHGRRGWWS